MHSIIRSVTIRLRGRHCAHANLSIPLAAVVLDEVIHTHARCLFRESAHPHIQRIARKRKSDESEGSLKLHLEVPRANGQRTTGYVL